VNARIVAALLFAVSSAGCASLDTHGCPGNKIGDLSCSAGVCHTSYDGEVFYLIYGEPANASELLGGLEISPLKARRWFLSNTGKFKLFVGGPNNGFAYEFTKTPSGWVSKLERDAYACTG